MNLQMKFLLHTAVSILIALMIMSFIILKLFDMQVTASEFSNKLLEVEQVNSSLVSYQQSLENYGKNPTESNRLNTISKFNTLLCFTSLITAYYRQTCKKKHYQIPWLHCKTPLFLKS